MGNLVSKEIIVNLEKLLTV